MVHLRLEGITKRFGSFVANDSISLEVQSGEIHAILGMSDRFAVMYRGQFMDILDTADATVETVGLLMMGEKVFETLDTITSTAT